MAKPRPEKKPEPAAPGTTRILPIQLQLGDRVTDATGKWEVSSGNLWLGFRLTRLGQSSRNPRKCFRPDVAASLLPAGFSHGHGGVRGRPNNTVRSTLLSGFILTSPSAPLSWFSLSSMGSCHHQMDHEVARGRYLRSRFRRTGRRRGEASYFPESSSVSDSGGGDVPQLSALASSDKRAKRRCDGDRRSPDFL